MGKHANFLMEGRHLVAVVVVCCLSGALGFKSPALPPADEDLLFQEGGPSAQWLRETSTTMTKLTVQRAQAIYLSKKKLIMDNYATKIDKLERKYQADYKKARDLLHFALTPPAWKVASQGSAIQLLAEARAVHEVEFEAELAGIDDKVIASNAQASRAVSERVSLEGAIERTQDEIDAIRQKKIIDVKEQEELGTEAGRQTSTNKLIAGQENAVNSIKKAKNDVNEAKDVLVAARKGLNELTARIADDNAKYQAAELEARNELTEVKNKLQETIRENESLKSRMDTATARVGPAKQSFLGAQEDVKKVADRRVVLDNQVEQVEKSIQNVRDDYAALQSKTQEENEKRWRSVKDKEAQKEELGDQVKQLQDSLAEYVRQNEQAEQLTAAVNADIAKASQQLATATTDYQKANQDFSNKQETLLAERRKLIADYRGLQNKVRGLKDDVKASADTLSDNKELDNRLSNTIRENEMLLNENKLYLSDEEAKRDAEYAKLAEEQAKDSGAATLKQHQQSKLQLENDIKSEGEKQLSYDKSIKELKAEYSKYLLEKSSYTL